MDNKTIYHMMVNWEIEAGEDFLDYFDGSFNPVSFMFWARGKDYISIEQLNEWEEAYKENDLHAVTAMNIVHNCHGDNIPFAIVSEDEWTADGQAKAYLIFAEFINESKVYQRRFFQFLSSN